MDLTGHGLRERHGARLILVRPDQHVAWSGNRVPAGPVALIDRVRGAQPTGEHR